MDIIKITGLCVLLLSCNVNADRSCDESALHPSIVKISSSPKNTASGVLIGENLVLTVLHALPVGKKLQVEIDNQIEQAELIHSHHGFDLALLKTKSERQQNFDISTPKSGGSDVVAISYPSDSPLTVSYGQAIKSTYKGLLTSTEIDAGSSGGAIFQCKQHDWYLVGVIRSYAAHVEDNELVNSGLTWSIPSEHVLSFLKNTDAVKTEWLALTESNL